MGVSCGEEIFETRQNVLNKMGLVISTKKRNRGCHPEEHVETARPQGDKKETDIRTTDRPAFILFYTLMKGKEKRKEQGCKPSTTENQGKMHDPVCMLTHMAEEGQREGKRVLERDRERF